jgi:hypothetical protein
MCASLAPTKILARTSGPLNTARRRPEAQSQAWLPEDISRSRSQPGPEAFSGTHAWLEGDQAAEAVERPSLWPADEAEQFRGSHLRVSLTDAGESALAEHDGIDSEPQN